MGRIGNVSNGSAPRCSEEEVELIGHLVRMLMKPGYRYVYVSRNFAIKNKLVPANVGRILLPSIRRTADDERISL